MKKALAIFALVACASFANAQTISQWTYETSPPADLNNAMMGPSVAADVGAGISTGLHASTATDWSTPAGNGSDNSFSANTWAVGDYWQFTLSTSGYTDLILDWDQAGSGTGPRDFRLAYSIDGTSFTDFASYQVVLSGFATNSVNTAAHQSFNLSAIDTLENQGSVYFRLIQDSTTAINGTGTVAAAGTDRIDNFTVSGTIPEPSVIGLIGLGSALLVGAMRYRRRS